jgi:curved DNA-binding protein CbpA
MSQLFSFDKTGARTSSPWQVLDLKPGASEAEIRASYKELVLRFPPETEPQRFIEINQAWRRLTHPDYILERRFRDIQTFSPEDLGFGGPPQEIEAERPAPAPAAAPASPQERCINENPDWLLGELLFYALLGLFTKEDELSDPELK